MDIEQVMQTWKDDNPRTWTEIEATSDTPMPRVGPSRAEERTYGDEE
jgi:hypothetical protein